MITFKPGTLENSLTLLVASGSPLLRAWAAISMSRAPIVFPLVSSHARSFPFEEVGEKKQLLFPQIGIENSILICYTDIRKEV